MELGITLLYKEFLVINLKKKDYHPNSKGDEEQEWKVHRHTLTFTSIHQICMMVKYWKDA